VQFSASRPPKEHSWHNGAIRLIADKLKSQGFQVWADVNGYEQPPEIHGHIPDLIAIKRTAVGIERHIVEVETCSSCTDSSHTKDQYEAFSRFDGKFTVVVPENCIALCKLAAQRWNIRIGGWEALPDPLPDYL